MPTRTPSRCEAEAHRIDGVVRDAEALHLDIADPEAAPAWKGSSARVGLAPIDAGAVRRVM